MPDISDDDFPLSIAYRIEAVCNDFERAWKAGAPVTIESCLEGRTEPERSALLRQLLLVDLEYRRKCNVVSSAEAILARFPELDPAWLQEVLGAPNVYLRA